jgi:hypothetical protein
VRRTLAALVLVALGVTTTAYAGGSIFSTPEQREGARAHLAKDIRPPLASQGIPTTTISNKKCVNGKAATFSCKGLDLLSFVPLSDFKGSEVLAPLGGGTSDLWGWTDPKTRDEYVLIGKTNGTGIFRITDPTKPVYLGAINNVSPAQLIWHDIKIYKDHAFIVSESAGHGMRVFDLTRLRGVTAARSWTEDVNYPLAFSAHNIAINEATGYAYIVGGNNGLVAPDACLSGLHMVDIRDPKLPKPAGCQARGGGPGTGLGIVGVRASPATSTTPSASSTAARTRSTRARRSASTPPRRTCRSWTSRTSCCPPRSPRSTTPRSATPTRAGSPTTRRRSSWATSSTRARPRTRPAP